jgi:hypothetical protein
VGWWVVNGSRTCLTGLVDSVRQWGMVTVCGRNGVVRDESSCCSIIFGRA